MESIEKSRIPSAFKMDRAAADRTRVSSGPWRFSRAADVGRLVGALTELRAHGPSWAYAASGYAPVPDPRVLPEWLADVSSGPAAPCVG